MDTRLIELFVEVERAGSFAAAARVLDQDPSSVSRAIAQLEREVGARLFQRTTRQLTLTEAGGLFLARVEPLMTELELAREEVASAEGQPRGRLCLTASVAFGQVCLLPHVPGFLEAYPEIELDLKFTDRNVDIVSERVDLAIRLAPAIEADLIGRRLMDTRYRICASPEYLARAGRPQAPEALTEHPAICFDLPEYRRQWLVRPRERGANAAAETLAVPIRPRLIVSSALALREAAIMGLGPALLADWLAAEALASGALVDLFPDHQATATNFETAAWLLYPSKAFLPRRTRVAIDYFAGVLGGE